MGAYIPGQPRPTARPAPSAAASHHSDDSSDPEDAEKPKAVARANVLKETGCQVCLSVTGNWASTFLIFLLSLLQAVLVLPLAVLLAFAGWIVWWVLNLVAFHDRTFTALYWSKRFGFNLKVVLFVGAPFAYALALPLGLVVAALGLLAYCPMTAFYSNMDNYRQAVRLYAIDWVYFVCSGPRDVLHVLNKNITSFLFLQVGKLLYGGLREIASQYYTGHVADIRLGHMLLGLVLSVGLAALNFVVLLPLLIVCWIPFVVSVYGRVARYPQHYGISAKRIKANPLLGVGLALAALLWPPLAFLAALCLPIIVSLMGLRSGWVAYYTWNDGWQGGRRLCGVDYDQDAYDIGRGTKSLCCGPRGDCCLGDEEWDARNPVVPEDAAVPPPDAPGAASPTGRGAGRRGDDRTRAAGRAAEPTAATGGVDGGFNIPRRPAMPKGLWAGWTDGWALLSSVVDAALRYILDVPPGVPVTAAFCRPREAAEPCNASRTICTAIVAIVLMPIATVLVPVCALVFCLLVAIQGLCQSCLYARVYAQPQAPRCERERPCACLVTAFVQWPAFIVLYLCSPALVVVAGVVYVAYCVLVGFRAGVMGPFSDQAQPLSAGLRTMGLSIVTVERTVLQFVFGVEEDMLPCSIIPECLLACCIDDGLETDPEYVRYMNEMVEGQRRARGGFFDEGDDEYGEEDDQGFSAEEVEAALAAAASARATRADGATGDDRDEHRLDEDALAGLGVEAVPVDDTASQFSESRPPPSPLQAGVSGRRMAPSASGRFAPVPAISGNAGMGGSIRMRMALSPDRARFERQKRRMRAIQEYEAEMAGQDPDAADEAAVEAEEEAGVREWRQSHPPQREASCCICCCGGGAAEFVPGLEQQQQQQAGQAEGGSGAVVQREDGQAEDEEEGDLEAQYPAADLQSRLDYEREQQPGEAGEAVAGFDEGAEEGGEWQAGHEPEDAARGSQASGDEGGDDNGAYPGDLEAGGMDEEGGPLEAEDQPPTDAEGGPLEAEDQPPTDEEGGPLEAEDQPPTDEEGQVEEAEAEAGAVEEEEEEEEVGPSGDEDEAEVREPRQVEGAPAAAALAGAVEAAGRADADAAPPAAAGRQAEVAAGAGSADSDGDSSEAGEEDLAPDFLDSDEEVEEEGSDSSEPGGEEAAEAAGGQDPSPSRLARAAARVRSVAALQRLRAAMENDDSDSD